MKLAMITLVAFGFSIASQASTRTKVVCEFREKSLKVRMKFVALNLEKKNKVTIEVTPKCQMIKENGGYTPQCPIQFTFQKPGSTTWSSPKDPYDVARAGVLNSEDSGDLYFTKEKSGAVVLAKSADDSCVSALFAIFENSGFIRGYYTARKNCNGEKQIFSKMICSVKAL